MILMETLCAELMTLPLIMTTFNQLSLVGLIANLLVVPLIPLAMLLAAAAGAAGMMIPAFAGWFAWPANLLLTYILDLVQLMAKIPFASLQATIAPATMIVFYFALFFAVIVAARHFHRRNVIITDKNPI